MNYNPCPSGQNLNLLMPLSEARELLDWLESIAHDGYDGYMSEVTRSCLNAGIRACEANLETRRQEEGDDDDRVDEAPVAPLDYWGVDYQERNMDDLIREVRARPTFTYASATGHSGEEGLTLPRFMDEDSEREV